MKESRRITPLRTILRNCLNHIENLETNRSICDNYDKEFQDLKQFSETLKIQKEFACTEGEKEVNRKKNRYKDILPFNVSRVVLNEYAGIPGSDYINANFIKGASGSPAYIASQGPLPNTVNDFWRMVVECEVQVIVMACNAQESGKHKCENYWVEKEGEEKRFGMVQICLVKASIICPDFLVRTMQLKYTNDKDVTEERTVCQFHYSAWPDHGVPPLVRPLLDMVRLVRDTQASETLPVLVHCSAGCGRTGTICAIDFVWGLLRAGKLTEDFSLFNLVRDMRKQRVAMVQTKEQYILVHQAVRELFKEQLQVIESHPYENIDFNGVPLIKDFEEPFYDTICIKKEENCDEKQDKSEMKEKGEEVDSKVIKADTAPPLPRKKRPNVLFSKQEKEAENLTEKNRSFFTEKEKEKTDASLSSILGKPRIVKLRALFEKSPVTKERTSLKDRGNQAVSRSHSLGAIRKPFMTEVFEPVEKNKLLGSSQQPSFESGKFKQSKSFHKSVPLIKRSKSLKTFTPSSQLSISPPVANDPKAVKTNSSKPEENNNSTANGNENFWPKPVTVKVASKPYEIPKECSKRRRSLESLMGDTPPTITWPNVIMAVEKDSNLRGKVKSDHSPKLNSNTIQGNKTADLIRQQLQRLSIETEKKVNNTASGLGTRERRNSFRQAVSKSDFQNIFRNFRELPSGTKKALGSEYFPAKNLESSKNKSDFSQYIGHREEAKFLDREGTLDVKLSAIKGKPVFDDKKIKLQESILVSGELASQEKKHKIKQQTQEHSALVSLQSSGNHSLDPRVRKVMPVPKNQRTSDELERNLDSKNLFLKKLNSEILSERERDRANNLKHNDTRYRSECEDFAKPGVSHFGAVTTQVDLKKSSLKTNVKSTGYTLNSENYEKLDGPKSKLCRLVDAENNEKPFQPWPNSNYHGHHAIVKNQKSSKPAEDFNCYAQASISNPNFYHRANIQRKGAVCQNPSGDCSYKLRRNEPPPPPPPQNVRPKDPFFSFSHKKNVASTKLCSTVENETLLGNYRRNPGIPHSELYLTVNSDYESGDKKLILASKSLAGDKTSKTFECPPWTHSLSSRSSGEASSSDQHSTKSDSSRLLAPYEAENAAKTDVKILKNADQGKRIAKVRPNDLPKNSRAIDLSNGSSKQRKPDVGNSAVEFSNYGIVATSILRQNSSKYSKDDFVLEEPTAPPRVKRHASVTIPRNIINNSDHVSAWVTAENKTCTDRNTALEADKNAWSGSFGVDLDAVAASMQQGESSVLKNNVWSGKNHLSTSSSSTSKKKQHYF